MISVEEKTGADLAADTLTEKLETAGWTVHIARHLGGRIEFTSGGLIVPLQHWAMLTANGPRSIGRPVLCAYWSSVIEPSRDGTEKAGSTHFGPPEICVAGKCHQLSTEAEMNSWVDALIAVATAMETP